MRIVHALWSRFPVEGYGGTERVAYWLGKAQAELGHQVVFLCLEGSYLPFAQTRVLPREIDELDPYLPEGTDVVQLYGTPNFKIRAPFLVNIGGNAQPGEVFAPNTVFVSRSHAERHGSTDFVYNGIDLSQYPLEREKSNYALFLSKASWRVKNLRGSIAIARDAGVSLRIAGGRGPWWYFGGGFESYGTIDGQKKLELLQRASALLFPVIWQEPFGLAVVEALACGTPVVATPRGSLPEIITDQCGALLDSHEELVEALQAIVSRRKRYDPEACRARVAEAFSHIKMAEKYLDYYRKILGEGSLRSQPLTAHKSLDPQAKTYYSHYRTPWF